MSAFYYSELPEIANSRPQTRSRLMKKSNVSLKDDTINHPLPRMYAATLLEV